ncbi:hypothetical protein BJF90_10395 [Pseudonocardia sp. CNS-004]|nr:hypothetical protein BJF90_10395 [Pseudonocardia sp. CNS-004]
MLTLDVQHLPDDAIAIMAAGEVDTATAARLSAAVHRELDRGPSTLLLDLDEVTFLGVAGLRVLQCAADRATVSGVPVRLTYRDRSPAQRALEAAGMVPPHPRATSEGERTEDLGAAGVDRERRHGRAGPRTS